MSDSEVKMKMIYHEKTSSPSCCFKGLHDEEGAQEEELDGALVCPSTQLAVVLHLRRSGGEKRRYRSGPVLLCGGSHLLINPLIVLDYNLDLTGPRRTQTQTFMRLHV